MTPMTKAYLLLLAIAIASASAQQYVAFDAASATSTYSAGNLAGSSAFAAQQALSGGSGYWCSSGSHAGGNGVTWTGVLNSRRTALGVKVDWAYAPGEVKIMTSSDGANFEEAKCWQSPGRGEAAFEESFMFDAPRGVKAVAIAMRGSQSWGYFGINSAALIAEPGPFMLVSGITSGGGEQCLVSGAAGVSLESCLLAIAAGDGREVMELDKDGQIANVADNSCITLVDGDTAGGGALAMEECSANAESSDGRTVFAVTASGQLKMPRLGNFCVTMLGEGASDADAARGADFASTSSDPQHGVKSIADGDAKSYWASALDPSAPVDVQVDFGTSKQVKSIEIDWEHPAQAFELQVAQAGKWTTVFSTTSNNLQTTRYVGPAVAGAALRIRMQTPHPTLGSRDGHMLYAIRDVRVTASLARAVVQDCAEAEDNTDSRDKFFMVAVPEFNPRMAAAAKQQAALLAAAGEHLGGLLAELHVAMPSLAACGFKASLAKHVRTASAATKSGSSVEFSRSEADANSIAVAAVAPALGLDMQALQGLVSSTRETLAQISSS